MSPRSNLSAIEIFLKERVIFIHEKASGASPAGGLASVRARSLVRASYTHWEGQGQERGARGEERRQKN